MLQSVDFITGPSFEILIVGKDNQKSKELISVINKMQISLGKEKAGEILEAEKEVAKKLRAHIKKD